MIRALAALAICVAALAGTASAASHKAATHVVRREAEGQIACTVFGCHRIPPNCHPQTAYYWNGMPTGYDAIACR
jgi:hypothetical protein